MADEIRNLADAAGNADAEEKGALVQLEDEYGWHDAGFSLTGIAEDVALGALDEENCPYTAEVGLTLTGEEEIRKLNRETRGIDRATDVLSFPMMQYSTPGDFEEAEKSGWDAFDPETGRLMLGDIVISVPRLLAQAEEYGHSAKREYAFLLAHSLLHLMGYDHMTPSDEKIMFAKQEMILNRLGITRP